MHSIKFTDLADSLKHGREIEFAYKGIQYSITNHSGFWYFCNDTDHILLETICRFEDKDSLVSKTAVIAIDDLTILQIFDGRLYDPEMLSIL